MNINKVLQKIKTVIQIHKNMGTQYCIYRASYEIKRISGILKKKYPTTYKEHSFLTIEKWLEKDISIYFFNNKTQLNFPKKKNNILEDIYKKYLDGYLVIFNYKYFKFEKNFDWVTNITTGYKYDIKKHWTKINDITEQAGDIKYVWEKSRFSFLYALIRQDFHNQVDCSSIVLSEISDWIYKNPINRGPNYKCSQEIAIRVLNWTFASFYYKSEISVKQADFDKITNSIYWQTRHIYDNIDFSRIAVRNNHAVTECLCLYVVGVLYPFFPEAKKWKEEGKSWFEQEIQYQIYEDGTHLQFSHNYQRVVLQLITWGCYLSEANGERFKEATYQRMYACLNYLFQNTDKNSGHLPNYGSNDGALLFHLNDSDYRDYRPTLNALYYYFTRKLLFDNVDSQEDTLWYNSNLNENPSFTFPLLQYQSVNVFDKGGIATIRDEDSFTFFKCTNYKDRPAQADNLHIDIWYKGENILRDAGSYKYNTDAELLKFFAGSAGHNTVMIGTNDQMKKGPRFIWLNWGSASKIISLENENYVEIQGSICAFAELGKNIMHHRTIRKYKAKAYWEVIDKIAYDGDELIHQIWNTNPAFTKLQILSKDNQQLLKPNIKAGWYSSFYGNKEESTQLIFTTNQREIYTTIEILE